MAHALSPSRAAASLRRVDSGASLASRHALRDVHGDAALSPDGSAVHLLPADEQARADAALRARQRATLLRAAGQLAALFVVCALVCVATLWIVLPEIRPEDKDALAIPRSFEQLKALNAVLQHYKEEHFARVMLCWIVVYMFLQAFSIPGSMYMSILAGAMWGVPLALPIVCASVATGATICYLISSFLGEVLVAMPKWKARVDAWKERIGEQDNLLSYMIVIRMMPLPPHNIVNILAPHLGIKIPLFWVSTFFGIFAVSVIHTTIGEKLDQMSSADDFNLLSVRNAILMVVVCAAALTPILVKRYTGATPLEEAEAPAGRLRLDGEEGARPSSLVGRRGLAGHYDEDDSDDDELPRVSLRHAMSGYRDEEAALPGARGSAAWRHERNASVPDEEDDDDSAEVASLSSAPRVFDDRREEAAPRRGSKAARVLGHHGSPGLPYPGSQPAPGLGERAGQLWTRMTGSRG